MTMRDRKEFLKVQGNCQPYIERCGRDLVIVLRHKTTEEAIAAYDTVLHNMQKFPRGKMRLDIEHRGVAMSEHDDGLDE